MVIGDHGEHRMSFRLRPEYQGYCFTVYAHAHGCLEIVQRCGSSEAALFVQSADDLAILRGELNWADRQDDHERLIDCVCEAYEHVLEMV
jgi:hypothetical protein